MDTGEAGSGSGGAPRMYICNICNNGFTNPRALGGHRNRHRQEIRNKLFSFSSSSSSHFSPVSSIPLPSPSFSSFTNPNNPPPYIPTNELYPQYYQPPVNPQHVGSSSGGRNHAEFLGLDLSLGLGSRKVDDDTHQRPPETGAKEPQDDDVDLDLRLGGPRHR